MMKLLGFVFCLLFVQSSFAFETYFQLDMEISVAGKLISSPRVSVLPGEYATVVQSSKDGELRLGITANETSMAGQEIIQTSIDIESVDSQGKLIHQGTAELSSYDGGTSYIRMLDDNGGEIFSLYLTATKETL